MRSVAVVAVVLSLLLAGVGMVAVASSTTDSSAAEDVTPGEEVAGAVIVGDAELGAEVEVRAFGHALQAAEDPEERAELIAARIANDNAQLENASQRLAELEEQREAGEITRGQYRAEVAKLAVQSAAIERTAERSAAAAPDVAELLEERGISVEAIEELRTNASELRGPEVAEIARNITGDRGLGGPEETPANVTPGEPNESEDRPGQAVALELTVLETTDSVAAGGSVEVVVAVENPTDTDVEQEVTLRINGQPVDAETVTLGPGDSTEITLVWETEDDHTGEIDAVVQSDGERVSAGVTVFEGAFFDVGFATVPDDFLPNETRTVEVEVTNTGEVADTQTIALQLDNATVATQEVSLEPGASQTVAFEVETDLSDTTATLEVTSDDAAAAANVTIAGAS